MKNVHDVMRFVVGFLYRVSSLWSVTWFSVHPDLLIIVGCLSRFVSSKASTFTTQGHAGGEDVGGIVGFVGGSADEGNHR